MKPLYSYALIAAFAAIGQASAAVEATTTPVGYVSLGNKTVGQPAVANNSDIAISIPLMNSAVFASTVVSTDTENNVITLGGVPTLPAGTPYVAVIESGAKEGLVALITLNADVEVQVSPQPGDSLGGILQGDKISIRPATTLKSFFAGNTLIDGIQLDAFSGNTPGTNLATDTSYFYFGGDWYDSGSNDANNAILYPGESFNLRNATGSDLAKLVVSGEVPKFNSRVTLAKLAAGVGQDNRVAYLSPVDQAIGTSGLGTSDGDELIFFDNGPGVNKAGASVFYFAGAWYDSGSNDVSTTFMLKAGEGYIYRRAADAATGDLVISSTQTYRPNL